MAALRICLVLYEIKCHRKTRLFEKKINWKEKTNLIKMDFSFYSSCKKK
jgi:hypothetical protein